MTLADTQRRRLYMGYVASLGSAFGYGSGTLASRIAVTDYGPAMVATAFSLVFGAAVVASLFYRDAIRDLATAAPGDILLVSLAGLSAGWGVSFYFLALSKAPIVLVAPLAGTHPLVSIVLTHLFLQRLERVTLRTVAGAMLVVVGVALLAVTKG